MNRSSPSPSSPPCSAVSPLSQHARLTAMATALLTALAMLAAPALAESDQDWFSQWVADIPTADEVGNGWRASPGTWFALRTDESVHDVTAVGGESAAIRAEAPDVTVSKALLGGANDGLKPDRATTLRESVVHVDYAPGAHADHVQATGDDGLVLDRVRLVAENGAGATDSGWNAAIFVHDGSTDWTIKDVYVQAGRADRAITSWYPVRLGSGHGHVDGLVIDRATMKTDSAVQVSEGVTLGTWNDVYIREADGSLTPVPAPAPLTGDPIDDTHTTDDATGDTAGDSTDGDSTTDAATPVSDVDFTVSPANPTAGERVTLRGTAAGDVASWAWDDANGDYGKWSLGDGQTITFTFKKPGTKLPRLVVTGTDGSTAEAVQELVVSAAPTPVSDVDFTVSPANPTAGERVTLRGTAAGDVASWTWDDANGDYGKWSLGDGQTITFTFKNPGTKLPRLVVTGTDGSTAEAVQELVVGKRSR